MVDIPEEEARYWTYKLEQINALGADNEVGTALFAIWRDKENCFIEHFIVFQQRDLCIC